MKRILLIIETSRSYGRGVMEGISRYALEHGEWSMFFDDRGLLEEPSEWLRNWKGDGIISRTAVPSLKRILKRKRCPVVELHGDGISLFTEVRICERSIGEMAGKYFMDRGFRNVGFYSFGNLWWSTQREEPFKAFLEKHGLNCFLYRDRLDKRSMLHPVWENRFEKPLQAWLRSLPKPVGVWAITDHQAFRVLEACQTLGLRVPEDVAILGTSNDTLLCNLPSPPISSIDVDAPKIGYEAARRLDLKMKGMLPDEPTVNIPPLAVVTRRSTDVFAVSDPDIALALQLIRENACDGITVAEVVRKIGISRRTIERNFFKYLKRSPHDEIIRVRIDRAKLLLQGTLLSITAVAKAVGFTNRDYFISAFHRETGTTPHAYRLAIYFASNPDAV